MPIKLSRYADGVMEATWLAAIIMAPLYFNKYSYRIFEPDKAALLRSLALIMLLCWGIKATAQALASRNSQGKPAIKQNLKTPLVIPVLLVAFVSIISTIFSVTPRISFWGSYVRLQGMYTTSAYLVLFFTMVANLRSPAQVQRLMTTAILTSLPISLYGILQHYGIDPIPWGGDVTRRVSANMGNPIFVAAFLILAFPLTVGRIVDAFQKILKETQGLATHTARATVYIFISALQLIAIFFSQSRGPWLGLFLGGFMLFLLLSLFWKKRWLTFSFISLAILATTFLVVLNIPNGPLKPLQSVDAFNRLSQLLNSQSRTARVRSLIWGGAVEMVSPHAPLEYPDGHKDPFNFLRPIIGYGPETMHWAYNRFYPPELAYVEARNASPDRSHNETWDSLVFTGLLGLFVYLGLFTSLFYYGLKWLGLVQNRNQRITFFTLYFVSGILGAVIFASWLGIAFAGLGLPFGLILGLILYLVVAALRKPTASESRQLQTDRTLILIVLLSGLVSHFAEINFGISIVSTKTYLYFYAALLGVVGYFWPQWETDTTGTVASLPDPQKRVSRRKKRKSRRAPTRQFNLEPSMVIGGMLGGLLLLPMVFEFIANLGSLTSTSQVLWTSLTQVGQGFTSYGILALLLTTWLSAAILLACESHLAQPELSMWKTFGAILGISTLVGMIYALWLSGSLAALARVEPKNITDLLNQTASLEGLTTQYYTILVAILALLGLWITQHPGSRTSHDSPWTPLIATTGLALAIGLVVTTNLRIIHADVAFKTAEPFANSGQWQIADILYRRAIDMAPDEDFYYLMLGRASLEYAKTLTDPVEQAQAFETAVTDLERALTISPLNPDHVRNLARLHAWWAMQTQDEPLRRERGLVSERYFEKAISLSPNNVLIWNEWAAMQFQVFHNLDRALELILTSIQIDPNYEWSQAFAGDVYREKAQNAGDETERQALLEKAAEYYQRAIEIIPQANYFYALANIYNELEDTQKVIDILEASLPYTSESEIWKVEDNLAHYYWLLEDPMNALIHAQNALNTAPASETERLQGLVNQLQTTP